MRIDINAAAPVPICVDVCMYIRNRQTATSSEDFGYAPEHLEELVLDLEFTFAEVGLS